MLDEKKIEKNIFKTRSLTILLFKNNKFPLFGVVYPFRYFPLGFYTQGFCLP